MREVLYMAENRIPTISLSDVQLARKACENEVAEETLLRRLYPKIFQTAWAVVGKRSLADDVAQLSAIEILKSLNNYRGDGTLEAWAGRITYRVAVKIARKEQRNLKTLIPITEDNTQPIEGAENELSRKTLFEKLVNEMERIPWKRRVALLLHLAHGYTVSEVAELTDVSPNTVKDRLRTAYKEMRDIMEKHPKLREEIWEEIS